MELSMLDLKVPDDLWATATLPEGVLERWLVSNGATVRAGEPVAIIRIEEALHEIMAWALLLTRHSGVFVLRFGEG